MDDIIIHMIIIAPLTKWLIGSNRIWNKGKREYGIYLALILLLCVGIYELKKPEQNFYEILELNSNASKTDIQQSFRRMTRIYHPDKNQSADSVDQFNKIREAYEVLSNETKKDYYDRFGDFSDNEISNFFYVEILIISIFQFAISFIFGFIYTYGKENEQCRMVICLYLTLSFCMEIIFRFSPESNNFLSFLPILNHYAPFEKVQAFRVLVPLIMNFILLLDIYFIDDEDNFLYLSFCECIFESNANIVNKLEGAIIYYAKLIDGMVDINSNFSWRNNKNITDIPNIYMLTNEQTYEKEYDTNDAYFSILKTIINEDIDLKIPKKELCRRFDWSRHFIKNIIDENDKQKNFIKSTTTKGIIFSSAIYIIGLVSHLLSK